MPPVQIAGSPFSTTWTGTGAKTAGGGVAVGVGDLIVVMAVNEGAQATQMTVPSNTGSATVSWTPRGSTLSGNNAAMRLTTGVVTVAGTLTVSSTDAANNWGFYVMVFAAGNHGGVGLTPADVVSTTGTPSLTAAWSAGSLVACLNGDWAAVAITGLAYLTAGIGTPTQINATNADGNYSTEAWYYPNATGGSAAIGESAPAGQTWTLGAIEILAPASSGVRPSLDPQVPWTDDFGPSDDFGPNPFVEDVVPLSTAVGPVTKTLTLLAVAGSNASVVRQAGKTVLAVPGSSAAVVLQAGKVLLATSAGSAVVARVLATGKTIAASSASAAVLVRQPGKVLAASSAAAAALVRVPGRVLAAVAGSTAVVVRQPGKVLAASVGSSASIASINARGLVLSAVAGSAAVVSGVRTRVLTLAAVSAASVVLGRSVSKTVLAVEVSSATVAAVPPGGTTAAKGQLPTLGAG